MRHMVIISLSFMLICSLGCKPKHPTMLTIDPEFDPNEAGTILVAPFISSITQGEDPDRESERITDKILWEILSDRQDHTFLSPQQMRFAVNRSKLDDQYEQFKTDWITRHEADADFLRKVKEAINVDLILVPHVYLWFKDEADYRESGTASSTQVGITLTLLDPVSGAIVWEATDENFKESVRTEGNRAQVSYSGWDRRVEGVTETGRDMYAAPPFEDVTTLVLEVLIGVFPEKGMFRE